MGLPSVAAWNELGARLGLVTSAEPATRTLSGRLVEGELLLEVLSGNEVTAADVAVLGLALAVDAAAESYDGHDSPPISRLTLELAAPLHVALRVQAVKAPALPPTEMIAPRRGKPGDRLLDPHYDLAAEDPAQASAFLAALPAREVLPAIDATGWLASFDARRVQLYRRGAELRVDSWSTAIETTRRLANRLQQTAATIASATWRSAMDGWEPPCASRGLTRNPDGSYAGVLDGRLVRAEPGVLAGKRTTRLTCRFAPPERADVRLLPQSAGNRVAHGAKDLQLGDRDFDARFVVLAANVELARSRLPADLRASLCAMQGRGIVIEVDAHRARLEAPTLIDDADGLGRGLDELLRLSRAVAGQQ